MNVPRVADSNCTRCSAVLAISRTDAKVTCAALGVGVGRQPHAMDVLHLVSPPRFRRQPEPLPRRGSLDINNAAMDISPLCPLTAAQFTDPALAGHWLRWPALASLDRDIARHVWRPRNVSNTALILGHYAPLEWWDFPTISHLSATAACTARIPVLSFQTTGKSSLQPPSLATYSNWRATFSSPFRNPSPFVRHDSNHPPTTGELPQSDVIS